MDNLVIFSLGSNVGDRSKYIKDAVESIDAEFDVKVKKSSAYDTPPLYFEEQENFYNCCVSFRSSLTAHDIFEKTSAIEKKLGRKRGIPQGPRTIDIDIIFVGDEIVADAHLTIPHPCMQDRLFVLVPLADIHPEFVHPTVGFTIVEILAECPDKSKITKIRRFWE